MNFGAAKITVSGNISRGQVERAGAFENLKLREERESAETAIPYWKQKTTVKVYIAAAVLLLSFIGSLTLEDSLLPVIGYAASIVVGGYSLFYKGIHNLIRAKFDMNTLMTIAVIGAAIIGEWLEGAIVVILFAVSEALERYSMDKARQSIASLMNISPKEALIQRHGQEILIPVENISIGDIMIVKPGQKLAMDGRVVKGNSTVNEAAITGESIPASKTEDDYVFAGTLNEEGMLEVEVTKLAEDRTIAKIIHLVEEAQAEKAPSQAFVDKFAKYYTPGIIVIAFLTAVVPPVFLGASWGEWVYLGLAVLVVGCPCALVVSTPVAVVTAIGTAAKHGVLIKGGIHLEAAGGLKTVAFDKTGTLTEGVPQVTEVVTFAENEKELLAVTAAIEKSSQHPLASAVIKKAEEVGCQSVQAENFQSLTGRGVRAIVDDVPYYAGSPELFTGMHGSLPLELQETIQNFEKKGNTVILLGTEETVLQLLAIADTVRNSARNAVQELNRLGMRTVMLTGDNARTAEAVGREAGVTDIQAGLLPEEKLEQIKSFRTVSATAMVGDGVNDAPALAASNLGVAMGGAGTDTALETADIALMADDLSKLPYTVKLSRRALRIIKQNITFSLGLKALALLLVIPGWLTLWIAIAADMGATLLVTINSLRLLKQKQ